NRKRGLLAEVPQASRRCAAHLRKFRKLLAGVRLICGSSASLSQVCGSFAEVPQARASVRLICGSSASMSGRNLQSIPDIYIPSGNCINRAGKDKSLFSFSQALYHA
ncbi:MAG: hypothetical protein SPK32_10410, partial [Bacteroidaceae bacterium]|nr:hypothetical protein [Bacteroidaceae bacterium]